MFSASPLISPLLKAQRNIRHKAFAICNDYFSDAHTPPSAVDIVSFFISLFIFLRDPKMRVWLCYLCYVLVLLCCWSRPLLFCSAGVLRPYKDPLAGRGRAGLLGKVQRISTHRLRAVVSPPPFPFLTFTRSIKRASTCKWRPTLRRTSLFSLRQLNSNACANVSLLTC